MIICFIFLVRTPESSKGTSGATLGVSTNVNQQRQPSPVPTEPDDPDPDFISNQLSKLKIKVRDYGMCPPYAISSPPPLPASSTEPGIAASYHRTNPDAFVPLTPETFDPFKALGEFEYRLRQLPRTLPIPGKTIRRLIEIGWITEDEVSKRCNDEDKKGLWEFDEHNRIRALKLSELRKRREIEFGLSATSEETGSAFEWGFDPRTGAYPYLVMRYDTIPSYAERDQLVTSVRPLFVTVDRVVRMAIASERERERDRLEAEEALSRRKKDDEEKEREESHRIEVEMFEEREKEEREEAMGRGIETSDGINAPTMPSAGTIKLPPMNNITSMPTARKRSPQQAWADDEPDSSDENEDLEAKRLRLARSQSETWYERERREQLEKQQQQPVDEREAPLSQRPPTDILPSQSQSPHKYVVTPSHSRNPSNSKASPSNPQSLSQSQTANLIPPEKQYPAPLSAYDPQLYPDAASVIESQSQSQQSLYPHYYHHSQQQQREDTPPISGEGEEEEDTRPNALKRSPKKGLKRGLTRGRTLVQIC
jgi:hypothetical protein